MVENSTTGLVWLAPDNSVVVPRGQLDQPALQRYAPRTQGRARGVRVELRIRPLPHGRHAGEPEVEIWLDGRHVGELTTPMSMRYGPVVAEIRRHGERVGAEARVVKARRGIEVEIRLPDVPTGAHAAPPVVVPPAPRPSAPPVRRRTGWPLLVGAGVVLGLLVISGIAGGRDSAAPTTPAPAAAAATKAPPTPAEPVPTRPVAPIPDYKPPVAAPFADTSAPPIRTVPATVKDVAVYDHTGDRDNERQVDRVIDGDPQSSWRTFHYFEPFPALKPGVGIMLSFASAVRPAQLTVTSPAAGTVVEIRSAPTADAAFADTTLIAEATLADGATTVSLTGHPTVTHLLVWITKLGVDDGKNVTEIDEIQVQRLGN